MSNKQIVECLNLLRRACWEMAMQAGVGHKIVWDTLTEVDVLCGLIPDPKAIKKTEGEVSNA